MDLAFRTGVVVAIVVVIVVIAWFNFVRYHGCARCPGTYSRREYDTCKYTGLGGLNVCTRGCSFITAEDLCCAAAQHCKVCGFLATDAVNTTRISLTNLGRG